MSRLEHNTEKRLAYEDGVATGISQGISQGEKQKQIEIAKKMLEKNKSIDEIIEFTELTLEEVERLKEI